MGFILDTVTLSELRKKSKAARAVIAWQAAVGSQQACVSVITMNEIRYGIRIVETRDPAFAARLESWYREILAAPHLFSVISVGLEIAEQAASFRAEHGLSPHDSLIAATAKIHHRTLATRNISDFEATGIALVNPWEFHAR